MGDRGEGRVRDRESETDGRSDWSISLSLYEEVLIPACAGCLQLS